jgi:hypothetical protein
MGAVRVYNNSRDWARPVEANLKIDRVYFAWVGYEQPGVSLSFTKAGGSDVRP